MIKRFCKFCKKEFLTYPSQDKKFCSPRCSSDHQSLVGTQRNQRICLICKKLFVKTHSKVKGLYCSYECMGVANRKPFIYRVGYRYLYRPDHPHAPKTGYVAEHRIVMEQKIGRLLNEKEVVHHINHNRLDNRIENLLLTDPSSHRKDHSKEQPRNKKGQFLKQTNSFR